MPESELLTVLAEAIAAVYRTIAMGLERNLGGATAAVADHFIHGAIGRTVGIAAVGTTGSAAGRATAGLILEALLGVESLFRSREGEFLATFTAGKGLVFVHRNVPPSYFSKPSRYDQFFSIGFLHLSAWTMNDREEHQL